MKSRNRQVELTIMLVVASLATLFISCGSVGTSEKAQASTPERLTNRAFPYHSSGPALGGNPALASASTDEPHWMHWATVSDSPPDYEVPLPDSLKELRDAISIGMPRWKAERVLMPQSWGSSLYTSSQSPGPTLRYEYADDWYATVSLASDRGDDSLVTNIEFRRPTAFRLPAGTIHGLDARNRKIRAILADADSCKRNSGDTAEAYVRAVNMLVSLGHENAIQKLQEYIKSMYGSNEEDGESTTISVSTNGGIMRVIALLFPETKPNVSASYHRDIGQGGSTLSPSPNERSNWPCFPMTTECDVPFEVSFGYTLAGIPASPHWVLRRYAETGTFRTQPLTPSADPLTAATRLAVSDRFIELRGWGLTANTSDMYSSNIKREGLKGVRKLAASAVTSKRVPRFIDDYLKGNRQRDAEQTMTSDWLREHGILARIRWSEVEGRFVLTDAE